MTPAQLKRLASQEPALLARLYELEAEAVTAREEGRALGEELATSLAVVRGQHTIARRAVALLAEKARKCG